MFERYRETTVRFGYLATYVCIDKAADKRCTV